MIHSAIQLKDKVRNLSGRDSTKSQTLIRTFLMERFLERLSKSKYQRNFILKGGMLVASLVGLDTRATMDIDTTMDAATLSKENAERIIRDIIAVDLDDGIQFSIRKISDIMEEHDYPGIRMTMDVTFDKLRQTIKIDISTGDVITPSAIQYDYHLMFEDRTIPLNTYNLETLLAEKLETMMDRDTTNTRMRDFYDVHVLTHQKDFDDAVFSTAFHATSEKRGSTSKIPMLPDILHRLADDPTMRHQWENYVAQSFYVHDLTWEAAMQSVQALAEHIR